MPDPPDSRIDVSTLEMIADIGRRMASETDLDTLLAFITDHLTRVLEVDRTSLFIYDPQRDELWSKIA